MATFPTLKVEIAFASDPLATSPTWVDVTADVRMTPGVQIRRGRSGEPQSSDDAGVCTFTLNNRGRLYDPTYSAGTYYGNLRARKQVRVTCTWSAVSYPLFYGFVTGFPVSVTDGGKDSVVEVTAYDGLSYLAGAKLSGDPLIDYLSALGTANAYLRPITAGSWLDLVRVSADDPGRNTSTGAGVMQAGSSLAPGLQSSSWVADGTTFVVWKPAPVQTGNWSLAFWIQTTAAGPINADAGEPDAPLFDTATSSNVGMIRTALSISTDGTLKWYATDAASSNITIAYSNTPINDGRPHQVAVVRSGSAIAVYLDGVVDTDTTATQIAAGSGFWELQAELIGGYVNFDGGRVPQRALWSSSMQDVGVFLDALTAAQVEAIYNLGLGVVPETSTVRTARTLTDAGWPSLWRDLTASPAATVGELVYSRQAALTELQRIERSEQGRVFIARNGYLTFTARYAYLEVTRSNTSQATFSDDGADTSYRNFGFHQGDEDVCNDMTVTVALPPITTRSTDATSKTTYGTIADTTDTMLSTYEQARDLAAGLVYIRKDATTRFDPVTTTIPASWATILGLELGDRYTLESTPMAVGSQAAQQALIDSIEWSISDATGWWFTVAGSPVPASFWVLGTSVLDTTTVLAF